VLSVCVVSRKFCSSSACSNSCFSVRTVYTYAWFVVINWYTGPKHVVESIPDYPDFAQDVYRVICDYFGCLVEPLFTFALYDDIITAVGMSIQWCIAKNGGGYTQRGVAKGLKVPCLFMITQVSIRCKKNPEVGIRRIPAYSPQYTTVSIYIGNITYLSCFTRMLFNKTQWL